MSNTITQTSSFDQKLLNSMEDRGIVQDRLPGDILTLPNNIYNIRVSVNDFVTADTINYRLEKLYDNWLYLISKSIIPSNNIPNNDYYTNIIADTPETGLSWRSNTTFPDVSSTTSSRSLNDIKKISRVQNIVDSHVFNVVATTTTNVILMSGTDYNIDVIVNQVNGARSDNNVSHPSNNIYFENITDHEISQSNELFVLDDGLDTLFKFDINGILTLDKAILNNDTPGRLMTGLIGGPGDISSRTKFKKPINITSVNNAIHVLDFTPTNSMIKVYDSELNWKSMFSLGSLLSSGPIDMKYNDNTRRFYVLCHEKTYNNTSGSTIPKLVVFDEMFNHITTHNLMNDTKHSESINGEVYKELNFSKENQNIFYITTNKNIYKKYVTRPEDFIGKFLVNEKSIGAGANNNQSFNCMSIIPATLVKGTEVLSMDNIWVYESTFEVIHKFIENSNYQKSIETQFDQKILQPEDMTIHQEESVSSFVYNKTFIKHLYNNMLVLENTSRRFATTYDSAGLSQYVGFKYLNKSDLDSNNYNVGMGNYIGVNEIVTTHTVNRCLERIYQLQQVILSNWQEKPTNIYPLPEIPIILSI